MKVSTKMSGIGLIIGALSCFYIVKAGGWMMFSGIFLFVMANEFADYGHRMRKHEKGE